MGPSETGRGGSAEDRSLPIVATAAFAIAGAVALGYALLWAQNHGGVKSLFDYFVPREEVTAEEKIQLLAALRNAGGEISDEDKSRALSSIQPEEAVEMTEAELQRRADILKSLRDN